MKKFAFALSALAAVTTVNTAFAAADGTVEIRGRVVDLTCEVETNYKNLVVVLDTVGKNVLASKGQTAAQKPFEIKLRQCGMDTSTDKASLSTIYAAFSTPSPADIDTENDGTLVNRASTGQATNVNIQLTNSDGSPINLSPFEEGKSGTPSVTNTYNDASGEVVFGIKENYKLTGTPVREVADGSTAAADILGKKIVGGETEFRSQAEGNNPNKGVGLDQAKSEYTLKYGAQYYATGTATPGIVEAFVTYNIAYK